MVMRFYMETPLVNITCCVLNVVYTLVVEIKVKHHRLAGY